MLSQQEVTQEALVLATPNQLEVMQLELELEMQTP